MMQNKYNFKALMELSLGVVGLIFIGTFFLFLSYYCFFEDGRWLLVILSLILCLPLFYIFIRNKLFLKFKILKSFSVFLIIYTIITILVDSSVLLKREKFKLLHPDWVEITDFKIIDSTVVNEKQRRIPDTSYINLHVSYRWKNDHYTHFFENINARQQPWFIYNKTSEVHVIQKKLDHLLKTQDYKLYIDTHSLKQAQLFFGIHTFDWRQSFLAILIVQIFQSLILVFSPFILYGLYKKTVHKNKS